MFYGSLKSRLAVCVCLIPLAVLADEPNHLISRSVDGIQVSELARKVVDRGHHKITYIRITPPKLPALPVPPPAPVTAPTPEVLAAMAAREAKTYVQLSVWATVYSGSGNRPTVSDLNWWHEGKRYQAWSNADFRLLAQVSEIETETHVYGWMPFSSEGSIEGVAAADLPAGFSLFTPTDVSPQYYFEGTAEDMEPVADTLTGLDYFHAYYQLHHTRLAEEYARQMAEAAAHAEELAKNPPPPRRDTVIHFWPVK